MEAAYGVLDDLLYAIGASAEWLTPGQFAERGVNTGFLEERRLWAAALESHLKDCERWIPKGKPVTNPTRESRRLDALAWLQSDEEGALTFLWYMDVLGLDSSAVRARVLSGELNLQRRTKVWGFSSRQSVDPAAYMRAYRAANRKKLREYNRKWMRRSRA
ncbi:MAG: hypothetical protein WA624_04895 [Methylocella sp.]